MSAVAYMRVKRWKLMVTNLRMWVTVGASVLYESHSHSGTASSAAEHCQPECQPVPCSAEIKYKLRANFIVRLLQRI